MKKQFKKGDIVQIGAKVTEIVSIVGGTVLLANKLVVNVSELSHVVIYGGFDIGVYLATDIPTRAYIIGNDGFRHYKKGYIKYYDDYIDEISVASIIKQNNIETVDELQEWIMDNTNGYYLKLRGLSNLIV